MKKPLLILLLATTVSACGEGEIGVTMKVDDLAGTYWEQVVVYRDIYENSEKTDSYVNTFNGEVIGGGGPSVWYLETADRLVQYVSLADITGSNPESAYKVRSCEYLPEKRQFIVHEKNGTDVYEVAEFTAQSLTLVHEWGDETYSERHTTVFGRFFPTDEWKALAADDPDFDEIDWSK